MIVLLAVRNLQAQITRTCLLVAVITSSFVVLVVMSAIMLGFVEHMKHATIDSGFGHIQLGTRPYFADDGAELKLQLIPAHQNLLAGLKRQWPAAQFAERMIVSGMIKTKSAEFPTFIEGVDYASESVLRSGLQFLEGSGWDTTELLIGEGLARSLNLKVGDPINLLIVTVDGAANTLDAQVGSVFRSLSQEFDERAVFMPLPVLQDQVQAHSVSVIVAKSASKQSQLTCSQLKLDLPAGIECRNWEQLAFFYKALKRMLTGQLNYIYWALLIMTSLILAAVVNVQMFERRSEHAIQLALGERSPRILASVLIEAMIILLVSLLLGRLLITLGFGLINRKGLSFPPPPNSVQGFQLFLDYDLWMLIQAALSVTGIVLLSYMLPGQRLRKLSILNI